LQVSPTVTVVIPVYNDSERLRRAVRSIRDQTWTDWELIVVDDGSDDGTLIVAEELAAIDERVRVIQQEHVGHAIARNRGMAEARGEWIAVQDSDDYSSPDRLERQLAYLAQHPTVGALGTYGYRVAANGTRLAVYEIGPRSTGEFQRTRGRGQTFGLIHSSLILRRELVEQTGGYPEGYPMGADRAFINVRLGALTDVTVLPERLVSIEIRPDSISRRQIAHSETIDSVIDLNLDRTLAGLDELQYEEAVQALGSQPRWKRALRRRRIMRRTSYTRGAAHLAAGSLRGVPLLLLAGLLSPIWVMRRLRSQVVPLILRRRP
jgi:glycosyltransferase involved in cell wall biosynthesis